MGTVFCSENGRNTDERGTHVVRITAAKSSKKIYTVPLSAFDKAFMADP